MKNQCLKDEGVDYSSGCTRAFVWNFEGSQRVLKVPNRVPLPLPQRGTPLGTLRTLWEPSKTHTNALIQLLEFYFFSQLVIKRGLELMASTLGSTFKNQEVRVRFPPLASSPPQVLLIKD